MRVTTATLVLLLLISLSAGATQTTGTLIATQTGTPPSISESQTLQYSTTQGTPPHIGETTGISTLQQQIQPPRIETTDTTQTAIQQPTPPLISDFTYHYNPAYKQLSISFTIEDNEVSTFTIAIYADYGTHVVTLQSETTLTGPSATFSQVYDLNEEPLAVILTYVTEYPGKYPPLTPITLPEMIINTNIIPIVVREAGNMLIAISHGSALSPVTTTEGMTVYAVSSKAGMIYVAVYKLG